MSAHETPSYLDLSKMMDHSLLNPTLTMDLLERGIRLALAYDTGSVCIMPFALKHCAELLRGSTVKLSTTIGFPHGGHTTTIKVAEARQAIADGCQELDMVVNISEVLTSGWVYVEADIHGVVQVAHDAGQKVKIIFENCYLNNDQKNSNLRNLQHGWRGLGEDVNWLWDVGFHRRRSCSDANSRPPRCAGKGRRRNSRP